MLPCHFGCFWIISWSLVVWGAKRDVSPELLHKRDPCDQAINGTEYHDDAYRDSNALHKRVKDGQGSPHKSHVAENEFYHDNYHSHWKFGIVLGPKGGT